MSVITKFLRSVRTMALAATVVLSGATLATTPASAVTDGYPVSNDVRGGSLVHLHIGNMACTGTLITPEWVLTARHCIDEGSRGLASVGAYVLGQQRDVVEWRRHPSVDLAVVRLSSPVGAPTANISGWHQHPGNRGSISGWGGSGGSSMVMGQQADAEIQRRIVSLPSPDRSAVLLEATIFNGRLLPGDSGGALWVNGEVAGVLSMSTATSVASHDGTMGWFVPVSEHLGWIAQTTGKAVPGTVGSPSPLIDATVHPSRVPAPQVYNYIPAMGSAAIDEVLHTWSVGSS